MALAKGGSQHVACIRKIAKTEQFANGVKLTGHLTLGVFKVRKNQIPKNIQKDHSCDVWQRSRIGNFYMFKKNLKTSLYKSVAHWLPLNLAVFPWCNS